MVAPAGPLPDPPSNLPGGCFCTSTLHALSLGLVAHPHKDINIHLVDYPESDEGSNACDEGGLQYETQDDVAPQQFEQDWEFVDYEDEQHGEYDAGDAGVALQVWSCIHHVLWVCVRVPSLATVVPVYTGHIGVCVVVWCGVGRGRGWGGG